jgi:multidrug resistance efflux pump
MTAAILMLVVYVAAVWLVFFRFKLMKFNIAWGLVSIFVGVHLLLIFIIGLRFVTPYSTNATVVQYTIQLIPRLPEPTLVTEVLVKEGALVKKGQPLFQFDRRPYEYKIQQLEAQLAQAKLNVKVLSSDIEVAVNKVERLKVARKHDQFQQSRFDKLALEGAARSNLIQDWQARVRIAEAEEREAQAELKRARLKNEAVIGGVNPTVADIEAQLRQAHYYLENTKLVAPADGRIINLQVHPGMVSGYFRIGAIAAFIVEDDRYLLATYYQENLKYVEKGQRVEIALDLFPGQIFTGHVESIWRGNGMGQYLPTAELPKFQLPAPETKQFQYAVKIRFDDPDETKFPIGAQGMAAIYTSSGAWEVLRKISLRAHSWLNFLYPLNI